MTTYATIGRGAVQGAFLFAGIGTLAVFISPFDLVDAVLSRPVEMLMRLLITAGIGALSGGGLAVLVDQRNSSAAASANDREQAP